MLILSGALAPGRRLQASRALAADFGCSRNTVNAALEQLVADGWITARRGSGYYVVELDELSRTGPIAFANIAEPAPPKPFLPGAPPIDLFPIKEWARVQAARWRNLPRTALLEGDVAGWSALRKAIAAHLAATRGFACAPDQVIVMSSTQAALHLIGRTLTEQSDAVLVEDPGYHGAARAFEAAGRAVASLPVDHGGADVRKGLAAAPNARLAYVTPTVQFPTGVAMSGDRRSDTLRLTQDEQIWIVEDNYDADLLTGAPSAPPLAVEAGDRGILIGSFNKLLFPALRVAYIVAPTGVAAALLKAKAHIEGPAPTLAQMSLADFMEQGYLASHLRAYRGAMADRRSVFLEAVAGKLPSGFSIDTRAEYIAIEFPPEIDDGAITRKGAAHDLDLTPLSMFYREAAPKQGLLIGYAAYSPQEIRSAAARLLDVLGSLSA
jgi:GntR family transcriptional regulator/MocR family aminotransferase